MESLRFQFTETDTLTPAQAYEQGYLDAYRHMKLPLLRVPAYNKLPREKLEAPGCGSHDPTRVSVVEAVAVETPSLRDNAAVAPNITTALKEIVAQAPQEISSATPEAISTGERERLESVMMYWIDLLTDQSQLTPSEISERIARDMVRVFAAEASTPLITVIPRNPGELFMNIKSVPDEKLKAYLVRYNVVQPNVISNSAETFPPKSLQGILDAFQHESDVKLLQQLDEEMQVSTPW